MAIIYCFTSTGNSLHASRKIAEAIGAEVVPVTYEPVTTDDDVIGIVFPVFFFGAPNVVMRFVRNLEVTNPNAYIFAVTTYGATAPGAVDEIRKYLRGCKLSYTASVKSVENYLPMYEVDDTDEVHAEAEQKMQEIIQDVKGRKEKQDGRYNFVNRLVKSRFPGRRANCDEKFTVSDACTGCGTCAKVCPVENIAIRDGRPTFDHRCEHCISCMHCCPTMAIDYGKSQGRARYVHPDVGVNGLVEFWGR